MNPFIISSVILSISFLIILIINIKLNNKIIKYLFIIFSVIYLILILLFDNNFVYQFLKKIVSYVWFPDYLSFVLTNLFIIVVFLVTIFKKNIKKINKIINYILFIISFVCYNIYQSLGIDSSIYTEYYGTNSLILVRIISISLILWVIINIALSIRGKYEK